MSRGESSKIEIFSDDEKQKRKINRNLSIKGNKKYTESIKMKSRNDDSSKSSSKSRKCKEDSEEELTTEEITDKTVSEESESESERKR